MTAPKQDRIFLAYAREDKKQIRNLHRDLKERGFQPWFDEVDLLPGQIWADNIPIAIRDARVFLACLSQQSTKKVGYVQSEFRRALLEFGKHPPGSIYLIPVRLDDCKIPDLEISDLGRSFREIQWVNLWEEDGLDRLTSAIRRALEQDTLPPIDPSPLTKQKIEQQRPNAPEALEIHPSSSRSEPVEQSPYEIPFVPHGFFRALLLNVAAIIVVAIAILGGFIYLDVVPYKLDGVTFEPNAEKLLEQSNEPSSIYGTVAGSPQSKTISHPEGGKIDQFFVQQGDYVELGQVLLKLEGQTLKAELKNLLYQRYSRQAKLDRLLAEREGARHVDFRPGLIASAKIDPHVASLLEGETRTFSAGILALDAENALLKARVSQANSQRDRQHLEIDSVNRQIAIIKNQSEDADELMARGFGTTGRARSLKLELDQFITARLKLLDELSNVENILEEAKYTKKSKQAMIASDIEREILSVNSELSELSTNITSAQARVDNLAIASPYQGLIINVLTSSDADSIKPNSPILSIVPAHSPIFVEALAPSNEVAGVVEGLKVKIRFPAAGIESDSVASGEVDVVSADAFSNDGRQIQQYKVRISIKDWKSLSQELKIVQGMPAVIVFEEEALRLNETLSNPKKTPLS